MGHIQSSKKQHPQHGLFKCIDTFFNLTQIQWEMSTLASPSNLRLCFGQTFNIVSIVTLALMQ